MRAASAYRIFLTRNSEYHVEDQVCIGVRDRRTGQWLEVHPALGCPLANAVSIQISDGAGGGWHAMYTPCLGEPLEFDIGASALRTSAVLDIEERGGRAWLPRPVTRHTPSSARVTR